MLVMGKGLSSLGTGLKDVFAAYAEVPYFGTLGLTGTIASLSAAGVVALAGAPGLYAMGKSLSIFAIGLKALSGVDIGKLETSLKGIQKLKATNAAAFTSVAEGIRKVMVEATAKSVEQKKIELVITHNDVGKTNQAIEDAVRKMLPEVTALKTVKRSSKR